MCQPLSSDQTLGSKLGSSKDSLLGISVKMNSSSCDLYRQYQFMCEMYWLAEHLLYMREMCHELNKSKIHQGGGNL